MYEHGPTFTITDSASTLETKREWFFHIFDHDLGLLGQFRSRPNDLKYVLKRHCLIYVPCRLGLFDSKH